MRAGFVFTLMPRAHSLVPAFMSFLDLFYIPLALVTAPMWAMKKRGGWGGRNANGFGPAYLEGVKSPWTSEGGHAPIHYDAHRISLIERQIENIKSSNATMCQLEYTATKGGPGGQARN